MFMICRSRKTTGRGGSLLQVSRKALLAGIAGAFAATTFAYAQFTPGTEGDRVLFEADYVTREGTDAPVVAEGNVRAYFGDRFLTSDRVIYDPVTDMVTAHGNVSITDAEGQTYFADEIELTGDLGDGIAVNFSALLIDDARLASANVIKQGEDRNILNKAVYTGCEVCKEDGSPKTPTWQMKAYKVIQDKENKVIRFHHSVFEVKGIPIMYSPYMQIPDPSVKRQSGLLTPDFGSTSTLGAYAEIPYYWAISDYQDFTFSPKFMEDQGVLYQGEYRLNRERGQVVLQGGVIDANEESEFFITDRPGLNTPGTRFHIFGDGYQDFAENWRSSFTLNYASDKRYFSIYRVGREDDLARTTDLFRPDRLTNKLRLQRRTDHSMFSTELLGFKSLRTREDNDYVGQAWPRIRYNTVFDTPAIGGTTELNADVLALTRRDGLDSQHAVFSAKWDRAFTTRGGHRFRVFSELRGDAYGYQDLDAGNELCNASTLRYSAFLECIATFPAADTDGDTSSTTTRFLPTAGVEWSYPLAKRTQRATYIVEPKIQLIASPEQDYIGEIVNEDSQYFEFNTTTLYRQNKSSGYDLWEDGQRANVGLSASAVYDSGLTIEGMIGQQFRSEESSVYSAYGLQPGLGETSSDIVGSLDVNWREQFFFDNSIRFDKDDGTIRRAESALSGQLGRFTAYASYLKVQQPEAELTENLEEFLNAALEIQLTDEWAIGGKMIHDLAAGTTTKEEISLIYSDECTNIILAYRNDPRRDLDFDFDRSLSIKIELTGIND